MIRFVAIATVCCAAVVGAGGQSTCAVELGTRARLQGTVRERVYRAGLFARDTVWLLETPAPLPACNAQDTSSDSARRLVQLVPALPEIRPFRGEIALVVGRMGRATTKSHRTPYIIFADSVIDPASLRRGPRREP